MIRKWSPRECDNGEKGETVYQIVVSTVHRRKVLELAHDLPMSGYLGIRKTYNRVLQHFYWPDLKRDVAKWCTECHTCQLGIRPTQNIPQVPLHLIPAFHKPFSHIIIECVGPMPKTMSQNEYLLTIMCSSTRFPESIPLSSIKTNTILKAMIKFFTLFGLPIRSRYQFYGSCIPTGNESTGYKTVQIQCIPSGKSGSAGKTPSNFENNNQNVLKIAKTGMRAYTCYYLPYVKVFKSHCYLALLN